MPVTIRATASNAVGATSVTIPATTQVGDLLMLQAAQYNSNPQDPSGTWTLISEAYGSGGSYTNHQKVWWRLAVAGDAGASITFSGASSNQYNYGGIILTVIHGHHPTTPIEAHSNYGGYNSPMGGGTALTTTNVSRRFFLISQMSNGAGRPNFSTPANMTVAHTRPGDDVSYYRATAFSADSHSNAGTYANPAPTTDQPGSWTLHHIAIREGNVLPNAPSGVVATDTVYLNAVPVSWTHNDPDANAQSKYQIRWMRID